MSTYAYFAKTGASAKKSQYEKARAMYEPRSNDYDASWHPDYTRRMMDLVGVRPDDRILLLACGTGLEAVYAGHRIGDQGMIIGIDASERMLAVAQRKLDADSVLRQRVRLLQHDMADLGSCTALEMSSFDLVVCSNALVLLENKEAVIQQWTDYLKPRGRMVIDIPHQESIPEGAIMEDICDQLGTQYPSDRSWLRSQDSFRKILESQGLEVKTTALLEKRPGKDVKYLGKVQLEKQFSQVSQAALSSGLVDKDFPEKAASLFDQEWDKMAVDGSVRVCESLYLYIAEKRQ